MTIYEHRTTMVVSAGSISSTTLNILGGLARQFLLRSNTATTVFRAQLEDSNGLVRSNYDFHTGELNDTSLSLPVAGAWTIRITNVSPADTFNVLLAVQE